MKRPLVRLAILLALALFLAACGGQTPTPVPPEQPPVEQPPPTEPEPPVTPPVTPVPPPSEPEPPAQEIPYYGEWAWSFEPNDGCCNEEGRFSIVRAGKVEGVNSGFGFYQTCRDGNCPGRPDGGVIMTRGRDGSLIIYMFRTDSEGIPVPVYGAVDDDGELSTNDQGRPLFEGTATLYEASTNETASGDFRAVLTDLPVAFPPVE